MVVLVMESVPESLRGECTRFMIEIKAGVFIGTINANVRELLWKTVKERCGSGSAILAYSNKNEQSYSLDMCGDPRRSIIDFDGLLLIKRQ